MIVGGTRSILELGGGTWVDDCGLRVYTGSEMVGGGGVSWRFTAVAQVWYATSARDTLSCLRSGPECSPGRPG